LIFFLLLFLFLYSKIRATRISIQLFSLAIIFIFKFLWIDIPIILLDIIFPLLFIIFYHFSLFILSIASIFTINCRVNILILNILPKSIHIWRIVLSVLLISLTILYTIFIIFINILPSCSWGHLHVSFLVRWSYIIIILFSPHYLN